MPISKGKCTFLFVSSFTFVSISLKNTFNLSNNSERTEKKIHLKEVMMEKIKVEMWRNLLRDQEDKSIQLGENSIPQGDVPSSGILIPIRIVESRNSRKKKSLSQE